MPDKLNIVAISGSLRSKSFNTSLLRAMQNIADETMSIDITTPKGIPVYDGDDEDASGVPQIVTDLAEKIRSADGVIIATPEYNFAIPGGLKNANDWISRVKDQPFANKPVGVVGAAAGPLGTARSQYQLRQNLVGLSALAMNKPEVFVGSAHTKFADDGTLTDEETGKFLKLWLDAFDAWVRRGF
ncbi:MAG: NADPH-dependent FMN reductase [Anderseniella sp.]